MLKTVKEVLTLCVDYLKAKDPSFSRRNAEDLLAFVLGIKRLDLYLNFDRPLEEEELAKIRQGLKRLSQHEPIQYIEGFVTFSSCKIKVDKSVLIPRPETELLVHKIIDELKNEDLQSKPKMLLDLCSGSGYIGIAIKKELSELSVILSDISEQAVAISQENAKINQVDVSILQGDLFAPLNGKKVDFLICNPPYLAEHEFSTLDPSVKNYEPKRALVAGPTGLELYEKIAKEMKLYVNERAWFEIGTGQGQVLRKLFTDAGYNKVSFEKDLSGHDRFLMVGIA